MSWESYYEFRVTNHVILQQVPLLHYHEVLTSQTTTKAPNLEAVQGSTEVDLDFPGVGTIKARGVGGWGLIDGWWLEWVRMGWNIEVDGR